MPTTSSLLRKGLSRGDSLENQRAPALCQTSSAHLVSTGETADNGPAPFVQRKNSNAAPAPLRRKSTIDSGGGQASPDPSARTARRGSAVKPLVAKSHANSATITSSSATTTSSTAAADNDADKPTAPMVQPCVPLVFMGEGTKLLWRRHENLLVRFYSHASPPRIIAIVAHNEATNQVGAPLQ